MSQSRPIVRPTVDEHVRRAAERTHDDREIAARVARDAELLLPLYSVQRELDQAAGHAEAQRLGMTWPFDVPFDRTMADMLNAAGHYRDVLRCSALAAESMISQMSDQLSGLESAMSAEDPQAPPKLTPSGAPHPLQEGGYDADSDPELPPNISDIEAMKEGKTTHAQAEALARAAGKHCGEPTPSDDRPADATTPHAATAPTTAQSAAPLTVAPNAGEKSRHDEEDDLKKSGKKK